MAEITASLIKQLRDKTGIGMSKCKAALEEANGDIELAITNLRKKGMATAISKVDREANEGIIGCGSNEKLAVLIEVNAETDFVINNDRFKQFVADLVAEALNSSPVSLEAFMTQKFSKEPQLTIDEYRATVIQAIGENIQVRRLKVFPKTPNHSVGIYSHLGGKIVSMVELVGSEKEEDLAKSLAMHVAAAAPDYLSPETVPAAIVEAEKEIALVQMQSKPAKPEFMSKILEGKLNGFYDAHCLERQKFIKDDSMTVGEVVKSRGKEINAPLNISAYARWTVGQ